MSAEKSSNPLLNLASNPPKNRFGALPFDTLKNEHFMPAIEEGIRVTKQNYETIRSNPTTPNFENTILALECASENLDLASEAYFNLLSAEADEARHALAKEISPKLAALSSDLLLDQKIFARVKAVYENSGALNNEQKRLVEKSYKAFKRNGALLNEEQKKQIRELDQKAATLWPKYSENVLRATNQFSLEITNSEDLEGLPEMAVEAAREEAKRRSKPNSWVFTLDAPSYIPFLTYSTRRELREKLFRAFVTRSCSGEFDNHELAKEIATLRHQRAQVLGYASHADYVLEERMAETPAQVRAFLDKILQASKPAAEREMTEIRAFKKSIDGSDDLRPWDVAFYSEKLKAQKFSFDEEELRPYFKLENVIDGVFEHARRLYKIRFKAVSDVPVYHPDVKVYEVVNEKDESHVGLFYADFFPRPTKKNGAWMTPLREQGYFGGEVRRPHVAIVCNFTKPTATKPSLLSYDEVRTLFHEFGHALHGLLSDCTYRSIAGTNVYWDFVELPSQIMENWVQEKEGLDVFARHFETGAPLPPELAQKIKDTANFQAGLMSMRQLSFGYLDMAWHSADPSKLSSVDAFEDQVMAPFRLLPKVEGACTSCSFSHIFSGGYSAGYYSYKWAEVLDADAFEYFKEKGLFNEEVATKFKEHILSQGAKDHPMELYKRFRGREPDPNALLKRDALI